MRCASGRVCLTFQIWLKARSIMPIMAADVRIRATAPTADRPLALLANWVRLLMMVLEIPFGIMVWMKYASTALRKLPKTGKVVKMARMMVSSGTSARVVVKVRLPATCGRRSSLRRRRAK